MNDVPIQSMNEAALRALDYVFGDHKQDHYSHKASAKYTHPVNPKCQASFWRGYPMPSYEELV